jgi:hypothetical protein
MMVGGSLSYYSQSYQGNSDVGNSGISFVPSFGYFVAENLAVGAGLTISSATSDNGTNKTVVKGFGIAPFARYYKFTSNEDFAFFAQAVLGIESGKVDVTPGGETKSSTLSFDVSPGFAYFFNDHWAAEFAIGGILRYESFDPNKDNDDDKQSNFNFGISSLSPNVGIRYHF